MWQNKIQYYALIKFSVKRVISALTHMENGRHLHALIKKIKSAFFAWTFTLQEEGGVQVGYTRIPQDILVAEIMDANFCNRWNIRNKIQFAHYLIKEPLCTDFLAFGHRGGGCCDHADLNGD